MTTKAALLKKWEKFCADCNKDSGYPHSFVAGCDLSALKEEWEQNFPDDKPPNVEWSQQAGAYVVS